MITVKDKPIAFSSDGTLYIFDSREEFTEWADKRDDYEIWAEPRWLLRTLREAEKAIDNEGEVTPLAGVSQWLQKERESGQADELGVVSENAVRAKKAQDDGSQRKMRDVV